MRIQGQEPRWGAVAARSGVAAAALLAVFALPAQTVPVAPPAQVQGTGKPILFDAVIAVIGDRAILDSKIRGEIAKQIEGARGTGHNPTRAEIQRWEAEYLRGVYQTEALAQAAKIQPGTSRQQIDQLYEQHMQAYERDAIERAGSLQKYTKELGILGETWDSVRDEQLTDALTYLAQRQSLGSRFRNQLALMVTPREMRRYYEANLQVFVEAASSDLQAMAITAEDDPTGAAKRAAAAAEAWRATDAPAVDLAPQFGAIALDYAKVRDLETDQRAAWIKRFAASAAPGDVSPPHHRGSNIWLLKVIRRNKGRRDEFSDPAVQKRLLGSLVGRRLEQNRQKLILRSQRTFRPTSLGPSRR